MKNENLKYVQRISKELEAYALGHMYLNSEGETVCHTDINSPYGWEPLFIEDYLDDVLDVEYIIQSDRKTISGVKVYITLGGPNCWIDTYHKTVELRWGSESANCGLSDDICDQINSYYQDIWDCGC